MFGMENMGLPARSKTDLDDDRSQTVLRAISTNFLKSKLDAKNREDFLTRELTSLKLKKKKAHTRISRTIKETQEQAENLKKDKARAMESRMSREASFATPRGRRDDKLKLGDGHPISRPFPSEECLFRGTPRSILKTRDGDRSETHPTSRSLDSCLYEQHRKQKCNSFPCIPCAKYQKLGFYDDDDRTQLRSGARGLTPTSREAFWEEIERTSCLRPLRQPYNRTVKQERVLTKIVKNMRLKNEKIKPKDWSVKYGDPTPLRKILNPARA